MFLDLAGVPAQVGSLWPSSEAARACPRGDMSMTHCRACQLIFNASFDPKLMEYDQAYDNSLESSAVFVQYAEDLAERLIGRYELRNKTVMEIGCGKGAFIEMLCRLGPNRGFGFDKTFDDTTPRDSRVTFVKEHFSREHARMAPDFVCSRHVLEHIPEPLPFLEELRAGLASVSGAVVYIEVPEVMFILRDLSIWDLMYEHCTYYGHEALGALLTRTGFEVLSIEDRYGGQFLGVEARPTDGETSPPQVSDPSLRVGDRIQTFAQHFESRRKEWQVRLQSLSSEGKRIAVWGAGGKTVSFMNFFDVGDAIDTVVDVNPRKQGHFLPGTGHAISSPERLREREPDTVIVMNPVYRAEIGAHLSGMGLQPEVMMV